MKPIRFHLHPDEKSFFTVYIVPTRKDMYAVHDKLGGICRKPFLAVTIYCQSFILTGKPGRPARDGKLGYIIFYKDFLGSEPVAHEIGHATIHWARENNLDILSRDGHPERFCKALGHMTKEFWSKLAGHISK